ncbi:MAG: DUF1269 domain-containing protein [Clostridia bacterium]|nr:DUF1269 domain-containing protein [Clostridia bacterium]
MITELRNAPAAEQASILQMALVKCDGKGITVCDSYDGIAQSAQNTLLGGLVGSLLGILGGPLGILLTGSAGALIGNMNDVGESEMGSAMIEIVADKLMDGEAALIILAEEESEDYLNAKISKFQAEILRYDAVDIAEEVDEAVKIQKEMNRQARMQLRKTKSDEFKALRKEIRAERKAELEAYYKEYQRYYNL